MVIFNSYVKLPEGKSIILSMKIAMLGYPVDLHEGDHLDLDPVAS